MRNTPSFPALLATMLTPCLLLAQTPGPAAGSKPTTAAAEAAGQPKSVSLHGYWGRVLRGELPPELPLQRADGTAFDLRELRGKPVLIAMVRPQAPMLEELATMTALCRRYDVAVVQLMTQQDAPQFAAFVAEHATDKGWLAVRDAAGTFVPSGAAPEVDQKARMEWHATTVAGRLFPRGTAPMLPSYSMLDAAGKLTGTIGKQWQDGLPHLLQAAGIEVAAADRSPLAAKWSSTPAPGAARNPLRAAGLEAPDFAMVDVTGKPVSLSALRGKVVVLDFWATWCKPCLAAIPHLQDLAATYGKDGVVVVGSCTRDTQEKFAAWVGENQAKYPQVVFAHDPEAMSDEPGGKRHYGVTGIPAQFVIGRDGILVGSVQGYFPGEVLLDALLAKAGIAVPQDVLDRAKKDAEARAQRSAEAGATPPPKVAPLGGHE